MNRPQPGVAGLAGPLRIKQSDRRFVQLQVAAGSGAAEQFGVNALEQEGAVAHPLDHRLAGESRSQPAQHLFLSIERKMVDEFGQKDVGEQAGADLAAGNHPRGQRGGARRAGVGGASVDQPNQAPAEEFAGLIVDLLGDFLADLDQGNTVGAHLLFGRQIEHDRLQERQILQAASPALRRAARRLGWFRRVRRRRLGDRLVGFDGGEGELELVGIHLLRAAAKVAPNHLLQDVLEAIPLLAGPLVVRPLARQ